MKDVSFSSLSGPSVGRIQYAPTIEYVRSFEIPMRFLNWVLMLLQKTVLFSSPSRPRGGAYLICPYDRVRVPLQNTDAIPQPGTCEGSKNCPVFILFGVVWWAYSIRPYDRVRVILQNTDAIPQLGTCGPSKNYPVFVSFGAAGWGVFDTPLRPNTCDPSKYRCDPLTGCV